MTEPNILVEYGDVRFHIGHQGFLLKVPGGLDESPEGMTREEYLQWYADQLQAAFNRLVSEARQSERERVIQEVSEWADIDNWPRHPNEFRKFLTTLVKKGVDTK